MVGWVSSPLLPKRVQGTRWSGLAHSSDWYVTFVEGLAGGNASSSGPRPSDGHNLWPALMSGGASPRTEVIHQVSNAHYDATTGQSYINGTVVSTGDGDGSLGMVRAQAAATPAPPHQSFGCYATLGVRAATAIQHPPTLTFAERLRTKLGVLSPGFGWWGRL